MIIWHNMIHVERRAGAGLGRQFSLGRVLMLVCCERDIDVSEFRQALDEHLRYRREVQQKLAATI